MPEVPASDAVPGIEPLDLDEGDLIESAVLVVKVSHPTGTASIHRAQSSGMSYWEALGMLHDAANGFYEEGNWHD